MKISIVTVCFNSAATIVDTLRTVGEQTYPSVEHVIIDGGSTDETIKLASTFGRSGKVVISEPDQGIYDAMNKGLRLATGDWIGFLNADDALAGPDVLMELAAFIQSSSADVVYGDLEFVDRDDPRRVVRRWLSGPFSPRQLRWGWMPPHPAFYVRRELVRRFGEFDTDFRIAADYDFMLRYLGASGVTVAYLPRLMVRMRTGGASGNRSIRAVLRRNIESYRILRKNGLGGGMALVWKTLRKVPQLFRLKAGRSQGGPG